jgi:ribonuclease P protein component
MSKLRFRFPASRRLKLRREFEQVRTNGRAVRGRLLTLGILRVESEKSFRVGLVTSRRVGGAVERNRVRRRFREIVRQHQHEIVNGVWLVLIARPGAAAATLAVLEKEWLRLARRGGVLAETTP